MPSPHKKSFAAEQLRRQKRVSPWPWIVAGIAVAVVVIGIVYALFSRYQVKVEPVTEPEKEEIKSIAVLPFKNLSADEEQEYFCEGIAEVIINALTHVKDLRVIASTSSFTFKGKDAKVREIGKELDVETILEGSVQKAGNRLRITAQLIKVADESHLFSETYDRNLEDIFAIQDTISLAIVEALKVKLLGEEKTAIEKRYTENLGAYELYLLGLHNRGSGNREKAVDYFQQAIDKDPKFALAYAGIADTYRWWGTYGGMTQNEAYPKAKEAAEKAVEIDETLAEAHSSLAWVSLFFDWDWNAAEKGFKRAIELNPGYADARFGYYEYLNIMGRFNEALMEMERYEKLNPLYPQIYSNRMVIYLKLGRYEEVLEEFRKGIEVNPDDGRLYMFLGRLYIKQGKYKEAIDANLKMKEIWGDALIADSMLMYTYIMTGEMEKAESIFKSLKGRIDDESLSLWFDLFIFLKSGENDKAIDVLEKSFERRDPHLVFIKGVEWYDPLRDEPRFKALLKKMGLE